MIWLCVVEAVFKVSGTLFSKGASKKRGRFASFKSTRWLNLQLSCPICVYFCWGSSLPLGAPGGKPHMGPHELNMNVLFFSLRNTITIPNGGIISVVIVVVVQLPLRDWPAESMLPVPCVLSCILSVDYIGRGLERMWLDVLDQSLMKNTVARKPWEDYPGLVKSAYLDRGRSSSCYPSCHFCLLESLPSSLLHLILCAQGCQSQAVKQSRV